jgi:iron(III) transport system permease protein
VLGAILPLVWLARLALFRPLSEHAHLVEPLLNSLTLAGSGGALTLVLAFVIAAAARTRDLWGGAALFAANAGYAAPGAIVAIGALALFAALRDAGLVAGASAALSLAGLLWIYAARFAAAGAQPIDAGLARLSNGLDAAARTSGAPLLQRLMRVDLPIAAPGAAAGALVIFVEILKELPATLILRPFDFDTLAVKAYAYASDERMQQAAAPALIVALAGMAPIIILSRAVMRLRAGAEAS